jgi:hypothetical protein
MFSEYWIGNDVKKLILVHYEDHRNHFVCWVYWIIYQTSPCITPWIICPKSLCTTPWIKCLKSVCTTPWIVCRKSLCVTQWITFRKSVYHSVNYMPEVSYLPLRELYVGSLYVSLRKLSAGYPRVSCARNFHVTHRELGFILEISMWYFLSFSYSLGYKRAVFISVSPLLTYMNLFLLKVT